MADIDCNLYVYEIPSHEVIWNRKEFYRLKKESSESMEAWLHRVQTHIKCCEFPKIVELSLVDKFVCELNVNEIESIQSAVDTWSFEHLNEYFNEQKIDVEHLNDENNMMGKSFESNEEIPHQMVNIKCEAVSYRMQNEKNF